MKKPKLYNYGVFMKERKKLKKMIKGMTLSEAKELLYVVYFEYVNYRNIEGNENYRKTN